MLWLFKTMSQQSINNISLLLQVNSKKQKLTTNVNTMLTVTCPSKPVKVCILSVFFNAVFKYCCVFCWWNQSDCPVPHTQTIAFIFFQSIVWLTWTTGSPRLDLLPFPISIIQLPAHFKAFTIKFPESHYQPQLLELHSKSVSNTT